MHHVQKRNRHVISAFLQHRWSDNFNVKNQNREKLAGASSNPKFQATKETEATGGTKPPPTKDKPKKPKKPKKAPGEEKPARTPQVHTDEEIRGMLAALQAEYPGMSYKDIVKYALRILCDKIAYLPPIRLARLDATTLRIQAGIAGEVEESAKRLIRAIIKAKLDHTTQARLTAELEQVIEAIPEERRTMLRQAAIPMAPELPEAVAVGIAVLEHEKLECPDESRQYDCDICIQILRAYRPPELDLPEDLRDPFDDLDPDESEGTEPKDNPE